MNRGRVSTRFLLFFLMLMFLMVTIGTGCSKSDDAAAAGSTISGTAAAGSPIIGTVTIKDSSSPAIEKVTTIAADGQYSFDVSGMTAPFAFRADGKVGGREYHLYSAAVSTDVNGTINITPFTDLIIANMAADIAANYYDSGDFSSMKADDLAAAEAALRAKLQPIITAMGLGAGIDLLRTSFNTDHTGLDAVIDVVKVTIDATDPSAVVATLTNILNQEEIAVSITNGGTTTDPAFTATGVAAGMTDLQAITALWTTFSNLFATSLPSPTAPALLALFPADTDPIPFLDNGEDLDSFLTDVTTDSSIIGIKFTNIVIHSIDVSAGTAWVSWTGIMNGRPMTDPGPADMIEMVKKGSVWVWAGNQRIAKANVSAEARYFPYNSGTQIQTGLMLNIKANYPAGAAVQSAVVTGPGLPGGGVILNKQISNEWFTIATYAPNTDNLYHDISDAAIDLIPENAEYTIVLKSALDGGGSVLATYTSTILKGPVTNSALSAASFPAITAPTRATLEAFNSGSLAVTWTLPTGLYTDWVEGELANSDWSQTMRVEANGIIGTTTSTTLTFTTPSFTVYSRNLWITAVDDYNRRFQIDIW